MKSSERLGKCEIVPSIKFNVYFFVFHVIYNSFWFIKEIYGKTGQLACSLTKISSGHTFLSTSPCPTDSCRNGQESTGMAQESTGMAQESTGMAQESTGMDRNLQEWTGMAQEWTKMDILEPRA